MLAVPRQPTIVSAKVIGSPVSMRARKDRHADWPIHQTPAIPANADPSIFLRHRGNESRGAVAFRVQAWLRQHRGKGQKGGDDGKARRQVSDRGDREVEIDADLAVGSELPRMNEQPPSDDEQHGAGNEPNQKEAKRCGSGWGGVRSGGRRKHGLRRGEMAGRPMKITADKRSSVSSLAPRDRA